MKARATFYLSQENLAWINTIRDGFRSAVLDDIITTLRARCPDPADLPFVLTTITPKDDKV